MHVRLAAAVIILEAFWKAFLARFRCVVCIRFEDTGQKASLHHIATGSGARSVFGMCPICPLHHQGVLGVHGAGPKAFLRQYRPPGDSEWGLLVWLLEDIAKFLRFTFPRGI